MKKGFSILFCLVLALMAFSQTAVDYYSKGEEALKGSQYWEALQLFEKAGELYKDEGDKNGILASLFSLGSLHNSLGQYDKAIEHFQKALALASEMRAEATDSKIYNPLQGIKE